MSRRERICDEILVLRCQQGDTEAYAQLVDRWQERLWRHAWRLTGDENAAWDAMQEAWIGISRGLHRLEDAAAFRTWAYQIVGNKCRDLIRREQQRRRTLEAYSEQTPCTEQEASDPPQHASLAEALGRLSGDDRAILALRYQEEFDTAEIAEILKIPAGTVKSRLHYARKRLRKYLEETSDE